MNVSSLFRFKTLRHHSATTESHEDLNCNQTRLNSLLFKPRGRVSTWSQSIKIHRGHTEESEPQTEAWW